MIPIGKKGRITSGILTGHYIQIQGEGEGKGGYLIITSTNADFAHGIDEWVLNMVELEDYFAEADWQVEWFE